MIHPMPPLPSDAELEILAALWRLGPSTVRAVYEAIGKEGAYTTTLKQMQVMTEKGLLVRDDRDRSHIYKPAVSRVRTQRQIASDILRRAFQGSAKSLVLGALGAQEASSEDLAEIRAIITELEERKKPR